MLHTRPAYDPQIIQEKLLPYMPGVSRAMRRQAAVTVGAAPATVHVGAAAGDKADPKDLGLYVGLPALGAGLVASLAGVSTLWSLLIGAVGGGAGYLFLDHKKAEEQKASETAAANALAASHAREEEQKANVDVAKIALRTDPLGLQVKSALGLFSIGYVPVPPGETSSVVDYKLATFATVPTDAVVKELTDAAKALGDAGYTHAQSQMADAAATAAKLKELGYVTGGTLTAPPAGGVKEAASAP